MAKTQNIKMINFNDLPTEIHSIIFKHNRHTSEIEKNKNKYKNIVKHLEYYFEEYEEDIEESNNGRYDNYMFNLVELIKDGFKLCDARFLEYEDLWDTDWYNDIEDNYSYSFAMWADTYF